MPTLKVFPVDAGFYSGWSSTVGNSQGWRTLDDPGAADDDSTYLILPKIGVVPLGQASFPFGSVSNILPTQIAVTCSAKIETGASPELRIGFAHKSTGAVGVDASTQVLVAGYASFTRTFTTNPLTGNAWQVGDMRVLELYVATVVPVLGTARVTLLNATITYTLPTNYGIETDQQDTRVTQTA